MDVSWLFGISLTASFLAGALALFAPCCITFLLPSYLGTIFRNHKKVMAYTLIFAFGLASVLVPVALGFRAIVFLLDSYHLQIYYLGALVMILMGVMTFWPVFHLPQWFHADIKQNQKITGAGIYGLGIMSGLTSACCAPVLFAAVTLTSLSPTIFQAIIVSLAYVLGIVMPLFIISVVYTKSSAKLNGPKRQKLYGTLKYLGASIFILTGILIAYFNYRGLIVMNQMEPYSRQLRLIVFNVAKYFQNPVIDLLVFGTIVFIFYKLLIIKKYVKK